LFCRSLSDSEGGDKIKGHRESAIDNDEDFYNYQGKEKEAAGSRYFCESLFWASQPKQAAKT
jgi:hypothetical protein